MGYGVFCYSDHEVKSSSYTVLEPDPVVYNRAVEWAKDYSNVTVLTGAQILLVFSSMTLSFLIHTWKADLSDVTINNCAVTYFVVECVKKLARKRTRFSFYCSSQGNDMHDWGRNLYSVLESLPEGTQFGINIKPYDAEVPDHCNYCKTGWLYLQVVSVVPGESTWIEQVLLSSRS